MKNCITNVKHVTMNYSQNNEQEIIANYFEGKKGILLDIGANDGITFSNSRHLLLNGWSGCLVEPSPSCVQKLLQLYEDRKDVSVFDVAIVKEDYNKTSIYLHVNDPHIPNDDSLLSTTVETEINRWNGIKFKKVKVEAMNYNELFAGLRFDFITIDAEGMDLAILQQIDFNTSQTQMVCVEYNGVNPEQYIAHCTKYGLTEIHRNAENLIFAL